MGGGGWGAGEVETKNSCKGKLSEKKIHARRVDQEKNSCIGLPHILHKSQKGRQERHKAYCVQNISSLNKLPAEFWSCK